MKVTNTIRNFCVTFFSCIKTEYGRVIWS